MARSEICLRTDCLKGFARFYFYFKKGGDTSENSYIVCKLKWHILCLFLRTYEAWHSRTGSVTLFRSTCEGLVSVFGLLTQTWGEAHPGKEPAWTYCMDNRLARAHVWAQMSSACKQGYSECDTVCGLLGHPTAADMLLTDRLVEWWDHRCIRCCWMANSHPVSPYFPSHFPARGGFVIQFWAVKCKHMSGSWLGLLGKHLPAEKGHSQLTDPSILHYFSHCCQGHSCGTWRSSSHLEAMRY